MLCGFGENLPILALTWGRPTYHMQETIHLKILVKTVHILYTKI